MSTDDKTIIADSSDTESTVIHDVEVAADPEKGTASGRRVAKVAGGLAGGVMLGGVAAFAAEELSADDPEEPLDSSDDAPAGDEPADDAPTGDEPIVDEPVVDEPILDGTVDPEILPTDVETVESAVIEPVDDEIIEPYSDESEGVIVEETDEEVDPVEDIEIYDGQVSLAESVDDSMSFAEAFSSARQEVGAGGVFVWKGQLYNTYTAEEWEELSADEKDEFDLSTEEFIEADVEEVELLGSEQYSDEEVAVAEVMVDDDEVYLVDVDPDDMGSDEYEFMVTDIDGDGIVDVDEIIDISEYGISADDFADGDFSDDMLI
ncbi:MAG: hypothetical protein E7115_03950 [Bacteroidales bacterium]|nr:hypothetical protein [Bacteroidales bacterium]